MMVMPDGGVGHAQRGDTQWISRCSLDLNPQWRGFRLHTAQCVGSLLYLVFVVYQMWVSGDAVFGLLTKYREIVHGNIFCQEFISFVNTLCAKIQSAL